MRVRFVVPLCLPCVCQVVHRHQDRQETTDAPLQKEICAHGVDVRVLTAGQTTEISSNGHDIRVQILVRCDRYRSSRFTVDVFIHTVSKMLQRTDLPALDGRLKMLSTWEMLAARSAAQ